MVVSSAVSKDNRYQCVMCFTLQVSLLLMQKCVRKAQHGVFPQLMCCCPQTCSQAITLRHATHDLIFSMVETCGTAATLYSHVVQQHVS